MARYRAAIIGTGRPRGQEGVTGAAISQYHVKAYVANGCDVVALADIRQENAEAFRAEHNVPKAKIYTDYKQMLAQAQPDIVSICTWPHLHAEMAIAAAEAGIRAIYCEKPMAPTWGEAKRMHRTATERGALLCFNHQRRFEAPYVTAKRLLAEGAIGRLIQIQAACPNLYDWGTHWFDMCFFYNGDMPAEWVMGQVDTRGSRAVFGVRMESQGVSYFGFQNGARGMLLTGDTLPESAPGASGGPTGRRTTLGAAHRLIGTDGLIEVAAPDSRVRLLNGASAGWQEIPLDPVAKNITEAVTAGVGNVLSCLESGKEPALSSHKAIRGTELIFGTYESVRRRGRVDLPLEIDGNPLHALLDSGQIASPAAS
jgi:predicted dehydrogenase